MTKTNAIRILETRGVPFQILSYDYDSVDSGAEVAARKLGVSPEQVFKTLVAAGVRAATTVQSRREGAGEYVVFCIPAVCILDRKKAAAASGHRSVELVPLRDLFAITGYVRGGCSPIGMRRSYPVYVDEIATANDWILINAGSQGLLLRIAPHHLAETVGATFADLAA